MREIPSSPCEFYIRFLVSAQPSLDEVQGNEIIRTLEGLRLDGLGASYIREVVDIMSPRPTPYAPSDKHDPKTRTYLKDHKIFDMWHPDRGIREAQLILLDYYLRDKLEPMLLSSVCHAEIARKLRKYTAISLTSEGVSAFGHYYWNRRVMSQSAWQEYLLGRSFANVYLQGLVTAPDVAPHHLPYVVGIAGPGQAFNSAEASARVGQIAYKYALELEHRPATLENTMALKHCMSTIEKADTLMRRSDVALRDVLRQFQKFRMKLDGDEVIAVNQLTAGNFSKSGEGTDVDEEDF